MRSSNFQEQGGTANAGQLKLEKRGGNLFILPAGSWRLETLSQLIESVESVAAGNPNAGRGLQAVIDGSQLKELDTSGAMLLYRALSQLDVPSEKIQVANITDKQRDILALVQSHYQAKDPEKPVPSHTFIERVGKAAVDVGHVIYGLLSFIGETVHEFGRVALAPKLMRMKEFFVQLELVCLDAIPIAALVTFLIGVVVAYLFAGQIQKYGGDIFIVDGVGISMCRELSPIIVAIIMAGRSGSAFTAQIGTMKLNEELDAIETLGLSIMRVLVFPRFMALVIAMPFLVFVGDIVGILGGMAIAELKLGITPATFFERLQGVLPLKHVYVGLIKAPVFAAFIAVIGCRMGLTVENNARSVGLHTTSTVVQSIVSVILLNAAFAVIFVELGI